MHCNWCKDEIDESDEQFIYVFEGKSYTFCSVGCLTVGHCRTDEDEIAPEITPQPLD